MTDPLWRFRADVNNLKALARAERAKARDCEKRADAYDHACDILEGTITWAEKDAELEASRNNDANP